MDTLEAIMTRRSTRKFKDRPVEPEKLEKVIEAGRYAPSGGNNQNTHFIVIKNKQVLKDLADMAKEAFSEMEISPSTYKSLANAIRASKSGNYTFHYNAPVLILLANKKEYGNNMADSSCAAENMMIAANDQDLGSCWINQLHWLTEDERVLEYLRELGLEEDECICSSVALGYADTENAFPMRTPLKRTGNKVTMVD